MLKIGIIDSGLPASSNYKVQEVHDFTGASCTIDKLGHGSAISHIISQAKDVSIISARVFDDKLVCTPSQIAEAIHWLTSKNVNIINMSLGLRNDRAILREACEQALAKNILLVAAAPSQGDPVYPSHYQGVIRATGDARCEAGEISWLDSEQADFGGYSGVPNLGPAGASIGCASVTAYFANIKRQYPNYDHPSLVKVLIQQSNYQGTQRKAFTR